MFLCEFERERGLADSSGTENRDEGLGCCHALNLHQAERICKKAVRGKPAPIDLDSFSYVVLHLGISLIEDAK